jgi:hypothetical protein
MLILFSSASPTCIGLAFLLGVGTGLLLSCLGLGTRFSAGGKIGVPETERKMPGPLGGGDVLDACGIYAGGGTAGECLVGDKPDM